MGAINIEEYLERECAEHQYTIEDYEGDTPRWCKGCGDFSVLSAIQKILRDNQIAPEKIVCVSGIGCSSRFPHYLNTYGFHGIHGRALPISTGIALARPDLKVLTVMGDGDCFSIGAGHWIYAIRYNVDLTVIVLDNEIYALTKKQASPTTKLGISTNTTPSGTFLPGLNPLSVVLGITNVSFVAQTATWLAGHLEATLTKAWSHKGLSFIRVLQRCPAFLPNNFNDGGRNMNAVFLENEDGIPVHKGFMRDAQVMKFDHYSISQAQRVAVCQDPVPFGLIYWNPELPTYQELRHSRVRKFNRGMFLEKVNGLLDKYAVTAD